MDADFDRYYHRDLAETIWGHDWPASKVHARISALPEESAFRRKHSDGWSSIHELLASIHDRVTTSAHGYRLEGKPKNYPRPSDGDQPHTEAVDPRNPADAASLVRFFGRPKN